MSRRNTEEPGNMAERLRQIDRLLAPRVVAPRAAPDDSVEVAPAPLIDVRRHRARMYVAGREPHFRDVTLLQPAHAARHGDQPQS